MSVRSMRYALLRGECSNYELDAISNYLHGYHTSNCIPIGSRYDIQSYLDFDEDMDENRPHHQ